MVVPVTIPSMGQIWKLLVLDRNTWNHIIVCKLFALRIITWSYNCLQITTTIIIIINSNSSSSSSNLKPYKCLQKEQNKKPVSINMP